jgi:hypothetical protein
VAPVSTTASPTPHASVIPAAATIYANVMTTLMDQLKVKITHTLPIPQIARSVLRSQTAWYHKVFV